MARPELQNCIYCGKPCRKYRNGRRVKTCDGCALPAMVENMNGIAAKAGPAYERWREGMLRHAQKLSG